jgi:hypothetical protein
VRVGVYIDTPSAARNKKIIELLRQQEASITAKVGAKVDWEPLEDRRASKISVYGDASIEDEEAWDGLREWMRTTVVNLREAVTSYLRDAVQKAESEVG